MQPKVNKFICWIDGRVAKKRSEREARYADGFGGGSVGVDGEGGPAVLAVAAAAAAAVTSSVLLKVFWGSVLRSQVGWGRNDTVLACFVIFLSSRGCVV